MAKKKKEDENLTREERKAKKRQERKDDKARIKREKKEDREAFFKIEDAIGFMRIINIISVILLVFALFLGTRYIRNVRFILQ